MLNQKFQRYKDRALYVVLVLASLSPLPAVADDWGYEGVAPLPAQKRAAGRNTIMPPVIVETKDPEPVEEQSAAPLARKMINGPARAATVTPGLAKPALAKPVLSKPAAGPALGGKPAKPVSNGGFTRTAPGSRKAVQTADPDGAPDGASPTTAAAAPADAGAGPDNFVPSAPVLRQKQAPFASKNADALDGIVDKNQQAARCWVQLFQTCNKQAMDYTQQKRVEAYLLGKARSSPAHAQELSSILKFWPRLMHELRNKPEMEMHYSDLFRALLRLREKAGSEKIQVDGSPYSSDADLITELLGLERVAVPGDPAFSEDAVTAYADMAIFIYEQKHAGRTIDGPDNRTMFAKVVVEKFRAAPTDNDRRAMASFDLAWAKFKIIWFDSNQETQQLLLSKLVEKGAASSLTVTKNPLLETVLSNWPWKTTP